MSAFRTAVLPVLLEEAVLAGLLSGKSAFWIDLQAPFYKVNEDIVLFKLFLLEHLAVR